MSSPCDPACAGNTPICTGSECVQCLNDSQCTAGNAHVCSMEHECVECTYDNQAYCISPSGVSGFCVNNQCQDGSTCRRPTTGKDASVCLAPNACCFNELTGGIQPCALDPSLVVFDAGRCNISANVPSSGRGDWCRSSYECGDSVTLKRLRDADPYGTNSAIIEQFGSACRDTQSGDIVNCIDAQDADPGSTIGCAGLQSGSSDHECVFCPTGSDQTQCVTYVPPGARRMRMMMRMR